MTDVLISGASVAGPSLAFWLHRYGFKPTVVERAPTLRGGGYAVDFRGRVHLEVLTRMGLLDEIRAHQTHLSSLTYVDAGGRPVARLPAEILAGDVEILRGDLAAILYRATSSDAEYVFGDSITALEEGPDGVLVRFERSAPRRFDLVIGADGVGSAVRRLAFAPSMVSTVDLGLAVCTFATTNLAGSDRAGLLYSVPGRTSSVYSAHGGADGIGMLIFASTVDSRSLGVAEQKRLVAEVFAGDGWLVPELLAQLERADDFYLDAVTQIQAQRWSTGRVALIGDAGYAAGPGGNGTGTAVVAAYVLAGELARAGGDHAGAFAAYERRLRSYVEGGQKQAAGGRDYLAPPTWKRIRQRDRFFRMLPYLPPVKSLIKRMSTRTAVALDLPDYPPGRPSRRSGVETL